MGTLNAEADQLAAALGRAIRSRGLPLTIGLSELFGTFKGPHPRVAKLAAQRRLRDLRFTLRRSWHANVVLYYAKGTFRVVRSRVLEFSLTVASLGWWVASFVDVDTMKPFSGEGRSPWTAVAEATAQLGRVELLEEARSA